MLTAQCSTSWARLACPEWLRPLPSSSLRRNPPLTHADWLGLLLDRELTHRRDKRLAARLRYATLPQEASVEDVD